MAKPIHQKLLSIKLRKATASDIPSMQNFIFMHGKNPWNYLPENAIKDHLAKIANDEVQAFIAEMHKDCAGFICFYLGKPSYLQTSKNDKDDEIAYLSEIVIHQQYQGRGIGTQLILTLKKHLQTIGIKKLYTERHADNPGSAGVMRKTGFMIINEHLDPKRRFEGSQKNTVLMLELI